MKIRQAIKSLKLCKGYMKRKNVWVMRVCQAWRREYENKMPIGIDKHEYESFIRVVKWLKPYVDKKQL